MPYYPPLSSRPFTRLEPLASPAMVEREADVDPPHTYECYECSRRVTAEEQPVECPDCGGRMRNVSKPEI